MPRITTVLLGTYRCNVDNVFGNSSKAYNLQIPIGSYESMSSFVWYKVISQCTNWIPEGLSVATKAGLSSGLGAVVVIGIVTALLIYRKILLQRKEYRTKTAEAIREFKEGVKHAQKEKEAAFSTTFKSGRKGSGGGGGGTNIFKKLGLGKEKIKSECHIYDSKEHTHHASILELPYDDSFEVDVAKWKIGWVFAYLVHKLDKILNLPPLLKQRTRSWVRVHSEWWGRGPWKLRAMRDRSWPSKFSSPPWKSTTLKVSWPSSKSWRSSGNILTS